jgi:ABC-type transport system involved in cytochrome c biogenesis permease subunit
MHGGRWPSLGILAVLGVIRSFGAVLGVSDRHWFAGAVLLYGVAAVFGVLVWRRGFRRHDGVVYGLMAVGLVLHTVALVARGIGLSRCPIRNLYEVTTFLLWSIGSANLMIGALRRLRFLGVFVSPLLFGAGIFALMPALDTAPGTEFVGGVVGWQSLHATFIVLAYGAFGMGALAGLMYLLEEYQLKHDKLRALGSLLPPITRVEAVTGGSLLAGVGLLTAGLAAGVMYMKAARGSYFSADPFVLYAVQTWLFYLGLVMARWKFAQRGRRLAVGAVAGFAFLLLTFWGFYLLSGLHQKARGSGSMVAIQERILRRAGGG